MWDDDEEEEWDRVMAMTDAEVEAESERINHEYAVATLLWEARTSRPDQYAHHRRGWLDLCRKNTGCAFTAMFPQLGRENRKRYQLGLWKLRWWYRTGTYPPDA